MRYLKTYKLFESDSNSEDIQWIKDCLLDLQDDGCNINIREYSVQFSEPSSDNKSKLFSQFKKINVVPGLSIRIHKDDLIPIEVGDNLLMIDSYLKDKGYVGYNAYDYDNPYSQSRYQVRVDAQLKDERNMYETEITAFGKMLKRHQKNTGDIMAPYDTIEVKYFKPNKESSSIKESWSNINELEDEVKDILLDLEDEGLIVSYDRIRKDVEIEDFWRKSRTDLYLEVYISRPWNSPDRQIPGVVNPEGGYPGNLFFWYEIKESITRITEWYYSQGHYEPINKDVVYRFEKDQSPLRFFASGIEMFSGCSKEEDFAQVGDFISFTNFRIMIKL